MKIDTFTVRADPRVPAGALHAFAREAAGASATTVLSAYVSRDGRLEVMRMGDPELLMVAVRGLLSELEAIANARRERVVDDATRERAAEAVKP